MLLARRLAVLLVFVVCGTTLSAYVPAFSEEVPGPDTTPPYLLPGPTPKRVYASARPVTVLFTWTYEDGESDPLGHDVQYRTRTTGAYGAWFPHDFGAPQARLERTVPSGEGLCARARAHDAAGNTSRWSGRRCTYVDGVAPMLSEAGGTPPLPPMTSGRVVYRFGAVDDYRVGGYDVAVRSAAPGRRLGAWTTRTLGREQTSVSLRAVSGSQWCRRFRARDSVGHVSPWSPQRCSTLGVDDRAFAASGKHARGRARNAVRDTWTELREPGATLTSRSRHAADRLSLWVFAGPRQGTADVFVAGRKAGRLHTGRKRGRWALLTLPAPVAAGRVEIVQVGPRPVRVDAVSPVR